MKKTIIIALNLVTLTCFGQDWIEHKLDSNLSVDIPSNFEIFDTLNIHIVKAQIDNAVIIIQRFPNQGKTATNIQSKDELIKNYKEFQKGVIDSQNGRLVKQRFDERDGLLVSQFSCEANMNQEQQFRHFLVVFLNENWYTVSFWEVKALTNELKNNRDRLFSSVKFPQRQTLENQMSDSVEGSLAYRVGFLVGKIIGLFFIVGIVILIVRWIKRN